MIKVLYLIDTLYQGGAETLVKDYCLLLDKSKFEVSVLCLKRLGSKYEEILQNNGIKVCFLYDYWHYNPKTFCGRVINKIVHITRMDVFLAWCIVKKLRPDVIHAHLFVLGLLKHISPKKETKIIYTVHSEPQSYWHCKTKLSKNEFYSCQWMIKNRGLRLIALHDSMQHELNTLFHVDNTIVVNNGINFEKFSNCVPKNKMREILHIPQDSFVVGHVGRFAAVKNHEFILSVFKKLLLTQKNAVLVLVGNGMLFEKIKNKVAEMNLTEKIYFLDNRLDVPDIMNAMDVFLFPSVYEGLGIVLIEAQKAGLPCVISDCIPKAAIVSNLVTSLSLNASDQQWVDALRRQRPQEIKYLNIDAWNMRNVIKKLEKVYCEG